MIVKSIIMDAMLAIELMVLKGWFYYGWKVISY